MRRGCSELAMAEHLSTPGQSALYVLTFEIDPNTRGSDQIEAGFSFRGRRLSAEPWFPAPWPILDPPDVAVQSTCDARDAEYEGLPDARSGEADHWHAYPPDKAAGTKNLSATRCAEPVRATPSKVRRCRS